MAEHGRIQNDEIKKKKQDMKLVVECRNDETKKKDMKLAIVALGLETDSLIMVNCAANLVIQVPTLLFQTDLVPDGRAGE